METRKTSAALLLVVVAGCSHARDEPRDTRQLPPGVGPGAIGNKAKIDPIIAERCTVDYRPSNPLRSGHEFKAWADKGESGSLDPAGRPPGPSEDLELTCDDREGVKVYITYQQVDNAPKEWREPVYMLQFRGPGDKVMDVARTYAGPYMTEAAQHKLTEIETNYIPGADGYGGYHFLLDNHLRMIVVGDLRAGKRASIRIDGKHAGNDAYAFPGSRAKK